MDAKSLIDLLRDGEFKKYQSSQAEIERIRRENELQRLRDEAGRAQALRNQNSSANRNANSAGHKG